MNSETIALEWTKNTTPTANQPRIVKAIKANTAGDSLTESVSGKSEFYKVSIV